MLETIPCQEKPSLEELDLRLTLGGLLCRYGRFEEARKEVEECEVMADELDVLWGRRFEMIERINRMIEGEGSVMREIGNKGVNEESTKVSMVGKQLPVGYLNDEEKRIVLKDRNNTKELRIENVENFTEES